MCRNPADRASILAGLVLAAGLLAAGTAVALPEDRSKPIEIRARQAELRQKESVSVYRGNVRMRQGTLLITGERITVHHATDDRPLRAVIVGDPATYTQQRATAKEPVRARAQRMEYSADSSVLHLLGSARVEQGGDVLTGDDIRYDMRRERILAESADDGDGGRVEILITPDKKTGDEQSPQPEPSP